MAMTIRAQNYEFCITRSQNTTLCVIYRHVHTLTPTQPVITGRLGCIPARFPVSAALSLIDGFALLKKKNNELVASVPVE